MGNYLFFLYSTTAEVFALFDLFLILLTYLIYTRRNIWVSFVFGLSLAHHHVILFFVPTLLYWVRKIRPVPLILGLLPYFYIPIAASGNAIINWDRAVNFKNFIRLLTREDYGTFVSSGFYGSQLSDRILQVKTYVTFTYLDFQLVGILLSIIGCIWIWRKDKRFALGLFFALFFLGPFFFFYASFPLVNRFTLGTYERFLLPSYIFLSIFIGCGVAGIFDFTRKSIATLLIIVLFFYPLLSNGTTLWRFWGLRVDRTAENLALDILNSTPYGAILLLQRDTPLFTSQYARYALGKRKDIKLLHTARLSSPDYPSILAKNYPDVLSTGKTMREFIESNAKNFPIVSNARLTVPDGYFWVPLGLVFTLTKEVDLPSFDDLIKTNETVWNTYHDPKAGLLSRYSHLMLSDVLNVYMGARIELGKLLVRAGKLAEAKHQFELAINISGDTELSDSYMYLGLTELFLDDCQKSLEHFSKAKETSFTPQPNITLYESEAYRACGEQVRAGELFSQFEKEQQERETPLN
ncbi:MAG: hypothetical protein ACD_36C00173G0001 [uncultured bacterium]|nr:MAG: hypothetical protein ACD_36C00173G0001 [uncultured bacterium]